MQVLGAIAGSSPYDITGPGGLYEPDPRGGDRGQAAFRLRFQMYMRRLPDSEMIDLYRAARDGQPYGGFTGAQLRSVKAIIAAEYKRRQDAYTASLKKKPDYSSMWQSAPSATTTQLSPAAPQWAPPPAPSQTAPAASTGTPPASSANTSTGTANVDVPAAASDVAASAEAAGMVTQTDANAAAADAALLPPPPAPSSKAPKVLLGLALVGVAFGVYKWKFAKR